MLAQQAPAGQRFQPNVSLLRSTLPKSEVKILKPSKNSNEQTQSIEKDDRHIKITEEKFGPAPNHAPLSKKTFQLNKTTGDESLEQIKFTSHGISLTKSTMYKKSGETLIERDEVLSNGTELTSKLRFNRLNKLLSKEKVKTLPCFTDHSKKNHLDRKSAPMKNIGKIVGNIDREALGGHLPVNGWPRVGVVAMPVGDVGAEVGGSREGVVK
jgi:hypothetical protein